MNLFRTLTAMTLCASALPATAAPVASFGSPVQGWTVGSGQPDGGFNLSRNDSPETEVGLRSQDYTVGVSANDGLGGNYFVAAGERTPGSGLAKWNLDLSVYSFESLLSNFSVILAIDWDPSAGVDQVTYDLGAAVPGSVSLFQASENLGFDYWGRPSSNPFDPFATGAYDVTLSLFAQNEPTVAAASTTIRINVAGNDVPEPGSLALAGLALGGLLLAGRRRTA